MRTDGGSIMGLTLMITGAGGFLGRAVVDEAEARGHEVRALTRDDLDLASGELPTLDEVDCVIHLAASLSGDWAVQARDTVEATRGVIAAMQAQPLPPRLVLASSIAVYSADAKGVVTEATPLEDRPNRRDAYARAKLAQEEMLRGSGLRHTILRPGAILGPGHLMTAHLGPSVGDTLILLERGGEMPVVSLTDCARAFVLAAEAPGEGRALNILGPDRPTRARYVAALRRTGWPRRVLPLNWRLLMPLTWLLSPMGDRLPGLLRPAVLRARMRPLRYDIAAAQVALDWTPQDDFDSTFARALEGGG
jgi:nucleoside-diphosphate-sugar epimerase